MNESTDSELLSQYGGSHGEMAFGVLVGRYASMVYATALRTCCGNPELAKDVSQSVFILLARQAASLSDRRSLAGWLYLTTRFKARNALREEVRRQARESEHGQLPDHEAQASTPTYMNDLETLMEETLQTIDELDRNAVLLRVVHQEEYQHVGSALGISEEAARKRVGRALERIRSQLEQRGIRSSVGGIALALASFQATAAPIGLAESITRAVAASVPQTETATASLASLAQAKPLASHLGIAAAMLLVGGGAAVGFLALAQRSHENPSSLIRQSGKSALIEAEIARRKWTLVSGKPSDLSDPGVQRVELLRLREQLDAVQSKHTAAGEPGGRP